MEKKKETRSLLIFYEDDGEVKNREVIILKRDPYGVTFNFVDTESNVKVGATTFITWARVIKIKEVFP